MNQLPPDDMPPAISLEERRRQKKHQEQQDLKPDTTRLTELEANMSKMFDWVGDLERSLKAQEYHLHRLLELMRRDAEKKREKVWKG